MSHLGSKRVTRCLLSASTCCSFEQGICQLKCIYCLCRLSPVLCCAPILCYCTGRCVKSIALAVVNQPSRLASVKQIGNDYHVQCFLSSPNDHRERTGVFECTTVTWLLILPKSFGGLFQGSFRILCLQLTLELHSITKDITTSPTFYEHPFTLGATQIRLCFLLAQRILQSPFYKL
jgi:hypothetical protein